MNELRFEALPYDEDDVLRFSVFASNGGFSGLAELYQSVASVEQFGTALMTFPQNIQHTVSFEYGDGSAEWPYHVVLRAQVMDSAGHSAIFVRIQSFCSAIEAALSEFLLLAEPVAINELGRHIAYWSSNPDEPLVWQPKA
jgi:hypothetical protein